jgi:hypothetical protein
MLANRKPSTVALERVETVAPAYRIILRALFSKKCGRLDFWRKPGLIRDHILIQVSRDLPSVPWYNLAQTDLRCAVVANLPSEKSV